MQGGGGAGAGGRSLRWDMAGRGGFVDHHGYGPNGGGDRGWGFRYPHGQGNTWSEEEEAFGGGEFHSA